MDKTNNEKAVRMGMLIAGQMLQIFDADESQFHIDPKEVEEDATLFMYAAACIAPAVIYNKITGDSKNFLEVNHIANQLCFQYMEDEEKVV